MLLGIESNPMLRLLHLYYILLEEVWRQNVKLGEEEVIDQDDRLNPDYITALALRRLPEKKVKILRGTRIVEGWEKISPRLINRMITQWCTIRTFLVNCYYIPFNKFVNEKRKKNLDVSFKFDNNKVTWVFKTSEKDKGFPKNTPKHGEENFEKFGNNKGTSDWKNNTLQKERQYDGNRPSKNLSKGKFQNKKKGNASYEGDKPKFN